MKSAHVSKQISDVIRFLVFQTFVIVIRFVNERAKLYFSSIEDNLHSVYR
jgi:hypothetical protein